jgi:hypothetical protein
MSEHEHVLDRAEANRLDRPDQPRTPDRVSGSESEYRRLDARLDSLKGTDAIRAAARMRQIKRGR